MLKSVLFVCDRTAHSSVLKDVLRNPKVVKNYVKRKKWGRSLYPL